MARARGRQAQAGFTLFELMVAALVSSAVLLPALTLLFATMDWQAESASRIALNQQARETFDLLANGAAQGSAGDDGVAYAYGLRGREEAFSGDLRADSVLEFESNGFTVTGARFAPMEVPCTAKDEPLPDCQNQNDTETVAGYISQDIDIEDDDQSVQGRTVEVTLTLTDPFVAQRGDSAAIASATYRGVFTLNREEDDP